MKRIIIILLLSLLCVSVFSANKTVTLWSSGSSAYVSLEILNYDQEYVSGGNRYYRGANTSFKLHVYMSSSYDFGHGIWPEWGSTNYGDVNSTTKNLSLGSNSSNRLYVRLSWFDWGTKFSTIVDIRVHRDNSIPGVGFTLTPGTEWLNTMASIQPSISNDDHSGTSSKRYKIVQRLEIDGIEQDSTDSVSFTDFSTPFTLDMNPSDGVNKNHEGKSRVYFEHIDRVGNSSTNYTDVLIDGTPPLIEIDDPDLWYNTPDVTINATAINSNPWNVMVSPIVEDSWRYELEYPDGSLQEGTGTSFSVPEEGSYILSLYVSDGAGNEGAYITTINFDWTAPLKITEFPETPYWRSEDVNIPIVYNDANGELNVSGIDHYEYRVNTGDGFGDWVLVDLASSVLIEESIIFTDEGTYEIEYRVSDNAGNVSLTENKRFGIDLAAPEIIATGTEWTNSLTDKTFASLVGEDVSEIATWFYSFDSSNGPWSEIAVPEILSGDLAEGLHQLWWRAIDGAGNSSNIAYCEVKIDRAAPREINRWGTDDQGNVYFESGGVLGSPWLSTDSFTFETDISDSNGSLDVSGIEQLLWTTDATLPLIEWSSYSPIVITEEGETQLNYIFSDKAGNFINPPPANYYVRIDRTSPVITSIGSLNRTFYHNTLGIDFHINPEALDALSGVDSSSWEYAFDPQANEWTLLSEGINADALSEGNHQLYLRVADNAGNQASSTSGAPFRVDHTPPVINGVEVTSGGLVLNPNNYLTGESIEIKILVEDFYNTDMAGTIANLEYLFAVDDPYSISPGLNSIAANELITIDTATYTSGTYDLTVAAVDAAGNKSEQVVFTLYLDTSSPGTPQISSLSHPAAVYPEDAVSFNDAVFIFKPNANTPAGPTGLDGYRWELSAGLDESFSTILSNGFETDGRFEINGLEDNEVNAFYFLRVWAVGNNGKESANSSVYSFRVDSTPPQDLRVFSTSHSNSDIYYNSATGVITWNQPADFTGISTYYYKASDVPLLPESLPENYSHSDVWNSLSGKSLVLDLKSIVGGEKAGVVYLAVCAEDFSGNRLYDQITLRFDTIKPESMGFNGATDVDTGTLSVSWDYPTDNIPDGYDHSEVQLLRLESDSTLTPLSEWIAVSAQAVQEHTFLGVDPDDALIYIVYLSVYDKAGNRQQYYKGLSFSENGIPIEISLSTPYEINLAGYIVHGEYNAAAGTGSAFIKLPLGLNFQSSGIIQSEIEFANIIFENDEFFSGSNTSIMYNINLGGYSLGGTGLHFSEASGLVFDELNYLVNLDESNTKTFSYNNFSVSSPPQLLIDPVFSSEVESFSLHSVLPPSEGEIEARSAWDFSSISETGFQDDSWYLETAKLDLSAITDIINAYVIIDEVPVYQLNIDHMSITPQLNPGEGEILSDFYLEAMDNTFLVEEAIIKADEIIIIRAKLLLADGLTSDEIVIENFSIDLNGDLEEKADFSFTPFTITQPDGSIITVNDLSIIDNGLIITDALMDGSSDFQLSGLTLTQQGIDDSTETDITGFTYTFFGFTVQGGAGTWQNGIIVLDDCSMILPASYPVNSVSLSGLSIRQDDKSVITPGVGELNAALTTGYGSPVNIDGIRLDVDGVYAPKATIASPPLINQEPASIEVGDLQIFSDGSVGQSASTSSLNFTINGFSLSDCSVMFSIDKLIINSMTIALSDNYEPSNLEFQGMALNMNGILDDAYHSYGTSLDLDGWYFDLSNIHFGETGMFAQALVELPYEFGYRTIQYDNFKLLPDGSYITGLSQDEVYIRIHGWLCRATGISFPVINGSRTVNLGTANVVLHSLMGWGELPVLDVNLTPDGEVLSSGTGSGTVNFLSTNGFEVDASDYTFTDRGLYIGGTVYFPDGLAPTGTSIGVDYPSSSIRLDSDGVITTPVYEANVSYYMAGFQLTGSDIIFNKNGLTINRTSANIAGNNILFPSIVFYPDGEIKINGSSFEGFTFPDASSPVRLGVTEFWLDDKGVNARAFVTLPPMFGPDAVIYFDRLTINADGSFSSETVVPRLNFNIEGVNFNFQNIELREEYFAIGQAVITLPEALDSKNIRISNLKITYDGDFILGGLGVDPFELWGYTIYLDNLGFQDDVFSFEGGVRLPYDFFIDEIAGLRINIDRFTYNMATKDVDFQVSVTESFGFDILDGQYRVEVNGLVVNKQFFELTQAQLILPPEIPIESVSVNGLIINIETGEVTLDGVTVDNLIFDYEGNHFELSATINQDGLDLYGTVVLSPDLPQGIAGSTLTVNKFELSSSGIGDIDASWTLANDLTIFDTLVMRSGSTLGFSKLGDVSRIVINNGYVSLGSNFPPELQGKGGAIQAFDLEFNENGPQLNAFTVYSDPLNLNFEGLEISNAVLVMEWIVDEIVPSNSAMLFSINGSGGSPARIVLTGDKYPEGLQNKVIEITKFQFDSNFQNLEFDAALLLPGSTSIFDGVDLINRDGANAPVARIGVVYNDADEAFEFSIEGTLAFGDNFPEGIAGLEVDIYDLKFNTNWELLDINLDINLPPELLVFDSFTILNGSINISKDSQDNSGKNLLFDLSGTVLLPDSLSGLFDNSLPVISLSTLKITSTGEFRDINMTVANINNSFFNTLALSNGSLTVIKGVGNEVIIGFGGNLAIDENSPVYESFQDVQFALDLEYSTTNGLNRFAASLTSAVETHPFEGIRLTFQSIDITNEYFGLTGSMLFEENSIWPDGLAGSSVSLIKFQMDWAGNVQAIEAALDHATIDLFGFTCEINDLRFLPDRISLASAVITMPEAMQMEDILVSNAGFTYSGEFYGDIAMGAMTYDLAGFEVYLENPELDLENGGIGFSYAKIKMPDFVGGISADLSDVYISPSGLTIGGGLIRIPDFTIAGGMGFKDIWVSFQFDDEGQYLVAGAGSVMIPGAGTFSVEVSFVNQSDVYPIGLKRAYFEYKVVGLGLPIGTTGLYLNAIRGGIAFGPPDELPQEIQGMFDNGTRLQLGVTIVDQTGGNVIRAGVDLWIDITDWDWAFQGNVTVLNGVMRGEIVAALTKKGFYGAFRFSLTFVRGEVKVYVFQHPTQKKTLVSGTGYLQFGLARGSILNFSFRIWPWGPRIYVRVPGRHLWLPQINAEFGLFSYANRYDVSGFKGYVSVPVFGRVGIFLPSRGRPAIGNVSAYKLYKPSWASANMSESRMSISSQSSDNIMGTVYTPQDIETINGEFIAVDKVQFDNTVENFIFNVPGKVKSTIPLRTPSTNKFDATTDNLRGSAMFNTTIDEEVVPEVERIVFVLSYNEGDPELIAISPSNHIYREGDANVEIEREEFGIIMIIMNPEPGNWTCEVSNALNPDAYNLQVFGKEKIPEIELFDPSYEGETVDGTYRVSGKADLAMAEEAEVKIYLAANRDELYGFEVASTTTTTSGEFTASFSVAGIQEGKYYIFAELNTENASGIKDEAPGSIEIIQTEPLAPPVNFTANVTIDHHVEIAFEDVNGDLTKGFELKLENVSKGTIEDIYLGYLTSTYIPGFESGEDIRLKVRAIDYKNIASGWSDEITLVVSPPVENKNSFIIPDNSVPLSVEIGKPFEYVIAYENLNPEATNSAYDYMEAAIVSDVPEIQVGFDKDYYDLTQAQGEIKITLTPAITSTPGNYEIILHFNNKANKALSQNVVLEVTSAYPEPYIEVVDPEIWNNLYPVDLVITGEFFFPGIRLFVDNEEQTIDTLEFDLITASLEPGTQAGKDIEVKLVGPMGLEAVKLVEVLEPKFNFIGLLTSSKVSPGGTTDYAITLAVENDFSGTAALDFVSASEGISVSPLHLDISENGVSTITVEASREIQPGLYQIVYQSEYNTQAVFDLEVVEGSVAPFIASLSKLTVFEGDYVSIYGNQFGTSGTLWLNGIEIESSNWSSSRIDFTVPAGSETSELYITRAADSSNSNSITLYVKDAGFNFYTEPESVILQSGDTEKEVLLSAKGYAEYVDLSITSSTPMISATLNENRIIPNGETTILLSIDPTIENGSYPIDITGQSPRYSKTITLDVIVGDAFEMTTIELPNSNQGAQYTAQIKTLNGNGHSYFTLQEGRLPGGLSLLTNGLIQGRSTEVGTFTFTIQAEDEEGRLATKSFSISVFPNSWSMNEKDPGRSRYNKTAGPADGRRLWQTEVSGSETIITGNNRIMLMGENGITGLDSATGALIYHVNESYVDMALSGTNLYVLDINGSFKCIDSSYGNVRWSRNNVDRFMTNGQLLYISDTEGIKILNAESGTLTESLDLTMSHYDLVFWHGDRLLRVVGNSIVELTETGWSQILADSQSQFIVDAVSDENELAYTTVDGRLVVRDWTTANLGETETLYTDAKIMLGENRITLASGDGMMILNRNDLSLITWNEISAAEIVGATEKDFIIGEQALAAINIYDGKTIWQNTEWEALDMALAAEKLFVLYENGQVVCYNGPSNILPPTTTLVTSTPVNNGWYKDPTTINLEPEDNESYVAKTYYRLNSAEFVEYTGPVDLPEGYNSIVYYSVDSWGKRESDHVKALNADYTPPVLNYQLSGEKTGDYWYKTPVVISSDASDALSGLSRHKLVINDGPDIDFDDGYYTLTQQGDYSIRIMARDVANHGVSFIEDFGVDLEDPTIEASSYKEPGFAVLLLEAEDSYSGIDQTEYTIDGDTVQLYTKPVIINGAGDYTISYRTSDNSGRTTPWQSLSIEVEAYNTGTWIDEINFLDPKPGQAHIRNIAIGERLYGPNNGRHNSIDRLPDYLIGADYIRFAYNDKQETGDVVSFKALKDINVYLLEHETSHANLSDWTLVEENYPIEPDKYFKGNGDIYTIFVRAGEMCHIPGTGTSNGYPNLVFVQYAKSNNVKIATPLPGNQLEPESTIDLFGFMYGETIMDYKWEYKLGENNNYTTIAETQTAILTLPFVERTTELILKLTCTTETRMSYSRTQSYEIVNYFSILLSNPGPGMTYGTNEAVTLEYTAKDQYAQAIDPADVSWQISSDQTYWSDLTGNSLTTPALPGILFLKAEAKSSPGRTQNKVFQIYIGDPIPIFISFGDEAPGIAATLGETLEAQVNGMIYGFSTDHTDRCDSFMEYKNGELVEVPYIRLKENANFQIATGKGMFMVSIVFGPLTKKDYYTAEVEGQSFEIHEKKNNTQMIETMVNVTGNYLSLSGSAELPISALVIQKIEAAQ